MTLIRSALVLAWCLVATPASSRAEEAAAKPADLRPLAVRLVNERVRPAYADLAAAAARHAADWRDACARPNDAALDARLRASYAALAEHWWRIEFVRFGPIIEDFRAERIDFWPDRRNATTRGVAALLDPAAPEPTAESVRAQSAAAQGLPALERILFDAPGAGKRRPARTCAAGRAIAANLAAIGAEVATAWEPLAARAAADESWARELVARLTTDVLGEFQTLIDAKLAALGKTAEAARPDGLEGRRAGLERAALARPIDGMAAMVAGLVGTQTDAATLVATLDTARSVAEGLPPAVGPLLADPKGRSKVVLLRDALRSAQEVALADLPGLVGTTVGFNSRDGD